MAERRRLRCQNQNMNPRNPTYVRHNPNENGAIRNNGRFVILGVIVGAVFGFVIAAYMAIRAVWYIVAFPISLLMRKERNRI